MKKIALLRDTAEGVAHINGYDFDPALTAINRAGSTYVRSSDQRSASGCETLYLSTDFENAAGAFEVSLITPAAIWANGCFVAEEKTC